MPKSPTAVEVPVKDLFSSNYLFNIPGYQRPYAWTEVQAEELFEDLWDFLQLNPEAKANDPAAIEQASTYFLGSIVLIKDKDKPEATVVDGQQRLTTLTILFACIRSTLKGDCARAIDEFIYEPGNTFKKLPDRFRLELRPLDAAFFKNYIQQTGNGIDALLNLNPLDKELNTDAKRHIRWNALALMRRLARLNAEQRIDLALLIANRCYLVVVSTPDFTSAFRIFSVLNSRGLDLSPIDILKAHLLESINAEAPAKVDAVTDAWERMEVDLGRENVFELLAHIRSMLRKTKAKGAILDELTVDLKNGSTLEFCETFLPRAKEAFEAIRSADYHHATTGEAVNHHLGWLNRLDFRHWIPPAMAFWMRHEKNGTAMLAFFRDLERLTYSMIIRRETDVRRIARFGELTAAIEAGASLWRPASPLQLNVAEQQDTYDVLNGDFYLLVKSSAARKAILLRLDSLIASAEGSYDHPIVSVEHVLPQTPPPDSEWTRWFPTLDLRRRWTHRIGNLALLTKSKNSAAHNYAFAIKKDKYFKHRGVVTLALTVQVLNHPHWTPDVVQGRHRQLLKTLEKHWRLEHRGYGRRPDTKPSSASIHYS